MGSKKWGETGDWEMEKEEHGFLKTLHIQKVPKACLQTVTR